MVEAIAAAGPVSWAVVIIDARVDADERVVRRMAGVEAKAPSTGVPTTELTVFPVLAGSGTDGSWRRSNGLTQPELPGRASWPRRLLGDAATHEQDEPKPAR